MNAARSRKAAGAGDLALLLARSTSRVTAMLAPAFVPTGVFAAHAVDAAALSGIVNRMAVANRCE